jgi:hypothetical protein
MAAERSAANMWHQLAAVTSLLYEMSIKTTQCLEICGWTAGTLVPTTRLSVPKKKASVSMEQASVPRA